MAELQQAIEEHRFSLERPTVAEYAVRWCAHRLPGPGLALLGTLLGSLLGILAANKLTNYRIEQLEKKVDKHNSVMERTRVLEEQMKVANHRLGDLEDAV